MYICIYIYIYEPGPRTPTPPYSPMVGVPAHIYISGLYTAKKHYKPPKKTIKARDVHIQSSTKPRGLGSCQEVSKQGLSKLQLLRKRLEDTMRAAEGAI